MKGFLISAGKIVSFVTITFFLWVLIQKLNANSGIEATALVAAIILCGFMILLTFPELKELNLFGFGFKKEFPSFKEEETKKSEAVEEIVQREIEKYFDT